MVRCGDEAVVTIWRQVKLLNSISENFNEAMRSAQSKVEYSKQFETIVKGVEVRLPLRLSCWPY